MRLAEIPSPTTEIQRQLDLANSQMALYARDLKRMVDAERQKARALAEANARLQILDRLKTDFLAFIAHELRTPLSTMMAVDMLDPHDDPQTQGEVIRILRNGYERLEKFIEKGLTYFRWLAAEEPPETATLIDIVALVRRTVSTIPELMAPGVSFQLSAPETPCLVRGQESHFTTVLQVLLDNALKFSQADKWIHLDVRITDRVILAVNDHGQGFPPELGPELLRPFTIAQVMHHSQGTGLNLALASAIVTAYGGHLQAASNGVGQGATFTIELPKVMMAEEIEL
jgi:signal transduction histidine kinase